MLHVACLKSCQRQLVALPIGKEIIPDHPCYPFNFCLRMTLMSACVVREQLYAVCLQIIAKCGPVTGSPWLFFSFFLHSCNPISAPYFVTAADLAALLTSNEDPSFLCDALLPPRVRFQISVLFPSQHTPYSVCSLKSVCALVCVNVWILPSPYFVALCIRFMVLIISLTSLHSSSFILLLMT